MTQEQQTYHEEQIAGLELMARLTDSPLTIKTFIDSWILLTFDLPHNEEGDRARREFLANAKRLGAVMHTESVYYMPFTQAASLTALEMAKVKGGEVHVWYSQTPDEQKAIELTKDYDERLVPEITKLDERGQKIMGHIGEGHYEMAKKMLDNTWDTVNGLAKAVAARGSEELGERLNQTVQLLKLAQQLADKDPDTIKQLAANA